MIFITLLLVIIVACVSSFSGATPIPTNRHNCDCSNTARNSRRIRDPTIITCENHSGKQRGELLKQLIWQTRRDNLVKSTSEQAMDFLEKLPNGQANTIQIDDLGGIDFGFSTQLPHIPSPALSNIIRDLSDDQQIQHLRQMRDATRNATILLRKFVASLGHFERRENDKIYVHSTHVPRHFYDTLEFALVQVYCPMKQLLDMITIQDVLDGDIDYENLPTPNTDQQQSTTWRWQCFAEVPCRQMERNMLLRINQVQNQITNNLERS